MKKRTLFVTAACMLLSGTAGITGAYAQQKQESAAASAVFPDENFRAAVYGQADLDGDGALSEEEKAGLTELEVKYPYQEGNQNAEYPFHDYDGVPVDVTGIEAFPNLKTLSFENVEPAGLSFQKLRQLESFCMDTAPEMELDFSGTPALKIIKITNMKLKKLDVSRSGAARIDILNTEFTGPFHGFEGADKLRSVWIFDTNLEEADFTPNTELKQIILGRNRLKKIRVAGLKKLERIQAADAALKSIDVSGNKQLKLLSVSGNRLTKIDVSQNHNLEYLCIEGNLFTKINSSTLKVSDRAPLKSLNARNLDKCTVFDVSYIKSLKQASADGCRLRQVKIGKKLTRFDMDSNRGMSVLDKKSFQAPEGAKLYRLYCSGAGLTEMDAGHLKELVYLYADRNNLKKVDVSGNLKLYDFSLDQNPLETLTASKKSSSRQKKKYQEIIKENGGKIIYKK